MVEDTKEGRRQLDLPKPPGYRSPKEAVGPKTHMAVGVPGLPVKRLPMKAKKSRRSCCCACCVCCAWVAFAVVVLLLMAVLAGAVAVAWYKPRIPGFSIEKLKVSRFDLKGGNGVMSHLYADVDLSFSVLNRNDKVRYWYGPMAVEIATEMTSLGHAKAPAFSQDIKNSTVFAVHTEVRGLSIGGATGSKLRKKFGGKALILDVDVSGKIAPVIGGWKSPAMPLTLTCYGLDQGKVAAGSQPRCSVYLFRMLLFN